jgi:hypothetical protein
VEQKVIFAEPEYRFEVPNKVSVREVMRIGTVGATAKPNGGESSKAGRNNAVKSEGQAKAGGGKEGTKKSGRNVCLESVHKWRDQVNNTLQLEKSVDNEASRGPVKQQSTYALLLRIKVRTDE